MLLYILISLISLIFILMGIAFFTLLERKMLSLTQIRLGPNKILMMGILQPIFDGVKLMIKEFNNPQKTSKKMMIFISSLTFLLMLQIWNMMTKDFIFYLVKWSFLGILIIMGLSVYSIILSGNFSSSKFGSIGSTRAASQSMSYEIVLVIIIFFPLIFLSSMNMEDFNTFKYVGLPLFILPFWWICCVAETNRAPFDLAEGESELISGFNVEYSSVGFVFIFLSEYGFILLFSFLTSNMFFNSFFIYFFIFFSLMIILRSSYPRIRYDMLMKFCWVHMLPPCCTILILVIILK